MSLPYCYHTGLRLDIDNYFYSCEINGAAVRIKSRGRITVRQASCVGYGYVSIIFHEGEYLVGYRTDCVGYAEGKQPLREVKVCGSLEEAKEKFLDKLDRSR